MELFWTVALLWTTMLAALPTLIPELLPVLTVVPDVTTTATPLGVAGPLPTVAVWSVPVQLTVLALVSVAHAAAAGKETAASKVAATRLAPWEAAVDLAWPRPNSEATVQRASASFQTTRNILFIT
ncbi:hypothetical protein GmRootV15_64760 (plasmid) [Variovorax sp. V15]